MDILSAIQSVFAAPSGTDFIVYLCVLFAIQFTVMFNKGRWFLGKRWSDKSQYRYMTWEKTIVWVLGVAIAVNCIIKIILSVLSYYGVVIHRFNGSTLTVGPNDHWLALMALALMAGFGAHSVLEADARWRNAELAEIDEHLKYFKQLQDRERLGMASKDES